MAPLPITAWSAVNALGRSTAEVLAALDAGRSGLGPSPLPATMETVVGAIPGALAPLPAEHAAYDTRLARIGWLAFEEVRGALEGAVARWGPHRVGVVLGTSTGGLEETEQAFDHWRREGTLPARYDYEHQHNFAAFGELLARAAGVTGPSYVVSTACSSSGKVASSAARLIRASVLDAVLIGGIDSLTRMTLQGFHSLGILSSQPCRPFGAGRDGINIGEGAALLLVEREASDPGAVLLGVGESADAYRMSSPEPGGRGAREAMERALAQAGLTPAQLDHINAHGTATPLNDAAESIAIEAVFGRRVPVSSTKGYTGHLLGGAGGTEMVFALHAIRTGRLPATLGATPLDPAVAIDVVTEPREQPVRTVLSNSFAFGGSNVAVVLGAAR
ncbi:MAG: beta-ketoacyl-ACP synthase [Sandaracinaceae bacterium]|nr:beta-ketoacyl-ACP synthase [Sandaracinaceae bacterium]